MHALWVACEAIAFGIEKGDSLEHTGCGREWQGKVPNSPTWY